MSQKQQQQQQQRFLAASSSSSSSSNIRHVGIAEMQQILRDYEEDGREDSKYCVIDVRGHDEVANTGKLSENVYTLPVQVIMQNKVFEMDPEDFEEACGFAKPDYDETLVFTCAAGVRSVYACHFAAQAGYSKLINYTGGANEWFTFRNF
jgi:rhodanese-related sulfurtransferase